jgi:transmembrane sensor
MKNPNPRISAELRAEAIEWLITFSDGAVDATARERFNDWLRTSPEHIGTYLRVAAFWQDADRIEARERRDIEALVRQAVTESNVHPLGITGVSIGRPQTRRRFPSRVLAAAAILFAIAVVATVWHHASQAPTYVTQVGELRTITLKDGSIVTLNADSRMQVSLTRTLRRIDLTQGQALFRVKKDSARPFIVQSSNTRITAVGTQFDVNRKSSGTVVTVLEGRVSIAGPSPGKPVPPAVGAAPLFVSAGEQAVVTRAQVLKQQTANAVSTAAWTTGLLVFDSEPLSEVARAFNRQNVKQLIVEDPQLQGLKISGVFPSTQAGRIVEFLRQRFGVHVIETDTEIRIQKPAG